jgi:enoyl-CoA hydratase
VAYKNIRLEFEDDIAVLTIAREAQLNALNTETLHEMEQALHSITVPRGDRPPPRALIVTGAGEKAFVAGADIAEMAQMTPAQAREFTGLGHLVFGMLESLQLPTIAAVNGYALGGGCELALSCDLLYASERAKLGLPEVNLGVIPGFGGTQRLTRLVGRQRAKELVFTGEPLDAMRAKEVGLVLDVLPPARLMEHVRAVAHRIAAKAPLAIAQAKRVIEWGADSDLRAGNELERQAFSLLFGTEDQKEGMKAFLEKRPARFAGK